MSLVIACGCVLNNYIDRDIDRRMARTRKRALVIGSVSTRAALLYATCLGIIGLGILAVFTNLLTLLIGLIGLFFYVVVYGWAKRRNEFGTLIGSISGALPPLAGYIAVSDHITLPAVLLFALLVFWQMPHFYAIALYRIKDYRAAGLPVMPIKKGVGRTKVEMLLYIVAFAITALLLGGASHLGAWYVILALLLSLYWLSSGLHGFGGSNSNWARQMFHYSLVVLGMLCIAIAGFGRW